MPGFALTFLAFAMPADPVELPSDVHVLQARGFIMPLRITPGKKDEIERIRLFVSRDQGKTWKHAKDYKTSDEEVTFVAPRDGLYWFALETVFQDGTKTPPDRKDFFPVRKVYVNTERKALKVQKSYAELQREVVELQKTVKRLQKKIRQLKSNRKPK